MNTSASYDAIVIGCGIGGFATAARLQAKGLRTLLLESHGLPGGCMGYYPRKGFHFDVGATLLPDFGPGGLGEEFLKAIGMPMPAAEAMELQLWLPDRKLTLYHDPQRWNTERLKLGSTEAHQKFWKEVDTLSTQVWDAARKGLKLPTRTWGEQLKNLGLLGLSGLTLFRHGRQSLLNLLRKHGLEKDKVLMAYLSMRTEDALLNTMDEAPLLNSVAGLSAHQRGLYRPLGGMKAFWDAALKHYALLGGTLLTAHRVNKITYSVQKGYTAYTGQGAFTAPKMVSALPLETTYRLVPSEMQLRMNKYIHRNTEAYSGALVLALGVREENLGEENGLVHQVLHDYDDVLANGNNLYVSVSSPEDRVSAPAGYRAVVLSTHTSIREWQGLMPGTYDMLKDRMGLYMADVARRIFPNIDQQALIMETAAPGTFFKFTRRPQGAVGGFKLSLRNSNQYAVPQDIGLPDFRLAGDSTWPGLGIPACLLGSRLAVRDWVK